MHQHSQIILSASCTWRSHTWCWESLTRVTTLTTAASRMFWCMACAKHHMLLHVSILKCSLSVFQTTEVWSVKAVAVGWLVADVCMASWHSWSWFYPQTDCLRKTRIWLRCVLCKSGRLVWMWCWTSVISFTATSELLTRYTARQTLVALLFVETSVYVAGVRRRRWLWHTVEKHRRTSVIWSRKVHLFTCWTKSANPIITISGIVFFALHSYVILFLHDFVLLSLLWNQLWQWWRLSDWNTWPDCEWGH